METIQDEKYEYIDDNIETMRKTVEFHSFKNYTMRFRNKVYRKRENELERDKKTLSTTISYYIVIFCN